jgi:hypothetical protein
MKWIIIGSILAGVLLTLSANKLFQYLEKPPSTEKPEPVWLQKYNPNIFSVSDEWYSNGTLHDATMPQWEVASRADQLATAMDFLRKRFIYSSLWDARVDAEFLIQCMKEHPTTDQSAAATAGACCMRLQLVR